ncbi:MAG: alpha/beta hydrolase [Acidobacteria bacterium]|nr:alpha/beta hydrolase [Acidobacteriota bacterium]
MALGEICMFIAGAPLTALIAPVGAPRPILVLPGFVTGDSSTIALRGALRSMGHRPHGWGLGLNVGPASHIADGIARLVSELADKYQQPIDVVGWSLGGIYGRILAINRPESVRQVISLGSPIQVSSDESTVSGLLKQLGRFWGYSGTSRRLDLDEIPVPSTTIWTRDDGIVPGFRCRQTPRRNSEAIEVYGTHCGMGHNSSALYVIADRIAQPANTWKPFDPPAKMNRWFRNIESG